MLSSNAEFAPYCLKRSYRIIRTASENPIPTQVDVEPLLQSAVARENTRFEQEEDDSEGLGVSSRPTSPLTEIESEEETTPRPPTPTTEFESEEEAEMPAQPLPSPRLQSSAKKRRYEGAKMRRAKKRVKRATSGHQPHAYAASPSTVAHRAKELKPLQVPADAKSFPAAGSGSWVGVRKDAAKKVPWTVTDLVNGGFTFVEWDGR